MSILGYGNLRPTFARRRGPSVPRLDDLLEAALKRAARNDFSDRSFVEALRRLLAAQDDEAELSAFGRYSVRFDAMRNLTNLLRFEAVEERQPDLLERPIERPVFITGLPRSGTTFLHALLAQDSTKAAPLSWQLMYPCGSTGRLGAALCRARTELQFRLLRGLAPELNALHPIAADAPQECTDITAQVFQSLRFENMYYVPSYQTWLRKHGHLNAYRFHKRFLQHLDAQTPGRRWILKSPDHVFALKDLKAVYPDAQIVFVHRDPVRVMASVAKLTEVLRRPFTRRVDPIEIGRQVCTAWVDGANRMIAAGRSDEILHLHYREVVAAPLEAAAKLCGHCGLTLTEEAKARMRAWLACASQTSGERHRYSLAAFGLDANTMRNQFVRYMDTFGVQPEWDGTNFVLPAPAGLARS